MDLFGSNGSQGFGVPLVRRASAIIKSCLPRATAEQLALVFGQDPAADGDVSVLTPIIAADGPAFMQA